MYVCGRRIARAGMLLSLVVATVAYRPASGQAAAGQAASCQLAIQANQSAAQQGGSEAVVVTGSAAATLTVTVTTSAAYPTTATLYSGFDTLAATPVSTTAQGFAVPLGSDSRAILSFAIPVTAPLETDGVQVGDGTGCSAATSFRVEVPLPGAFTGSTFLALPRVLLRGPELPPLQGSVVHERVRIMTAPGAVVTTTARISATTGALGTATDGGTAYASGDSFFGDAQTADANGAVFVSVPLSATLLRPGMGGRVLVRVDSTSGGVTTEYRTSLSLRETGLHLLAYPIATTRGGLRPIFHLARLSSGHTALRIGVIADGGTHLSGVATFGANPALTATATAGVGRRALLTFDVPNSYAAPGSMRRATVQVTGAYRGAAVARTVGVVYRRG